MNCPSGSTKDQISTAELLEIGRATEPTLTERKLEYWRSRGLLPSPVRSGQDGKRPIWTYPSEVTAHLQALLQLRSQSKDPNVLIPALWFQGYPIKVRDVRSAILSYLRKLKDDIEKQLSKNLPESTGEMSQDESRWQALEQVASVAARKRGAKVPRLSRQSLRERTEAITLLFGLVLGESRASADLGIAAPSVERFVGIDKGRRFRPGGTDPWMQSPPEESLKIFAEVGGLDRLIQVMESASGELICSARTFCLGLIGGLAALSKFADAVTGRDNSSGFAGMLMFQDDPLTAVLILPLFVAILSSSLLSEPLSNVVSALQEQVIPTEQYVRRLAAMSEAELKDELPKIDELPFAQQAAIKRLISQYKNTNTNLIIQGTPG